MCLNLLHLCYIIGIARLLGLRICSYTCDSDVQIKKSSVLRCVLEIIIRIQQFVHQFFIKQKLEQFRGVIEIFRKVF